VHEAIMAGSLQAASQTADNGEEDQPYMLSVEGNVGIIKISGSLTNRDSPYMRYYGGTASSYADIKRALVAAAQNPDIQGILLDINSGGGAVSGVADTANLIRQIGTQLKPVVAFTDGTMASAAYWLGSAANKVYGSNTSLTGSIGVITTHMEYSKAYKDAGVGVSVMRAGEFKALANGHEPLTQAARDQVQAQLNSAYGVFIGHVAEMRGTTVPHADEKMGQGREFFGADAHAAGLLDGITTFADLLGQFQAKLVDKSNIPSYNSVNTNRASFTMKTTLTAQELAALAAGVTLNAGPDGAADDAEKARLAAEAETARLAAEAEAARLAADAASKTAPEVTLLQKEKAEALALVGALQSQIKEKDVELVQARVDLGLAQARIAPLEAAVKPLAAIVATSISTMKVALGMSAVDLSALAPEALAAEHAATATTFKDKFKAGGVAAVPAAEKKDETSASVDTTRHMARVHATRINK
jgi:signal peptide peptidase SppA